MHRRGVRVGRAGVEQATSLARRYCSRVPSARVPLAKPGPAWLAVAVVALFAVVAGYHLRLPGLMYDEVLQVTQVGSFRAGRLDGMAIWTGPKVGIGGHQVAAMTTTYLGSVKTLLFLPVGIVFGTGPVVVRLFTVSLAVLALVFAYLFARRAFRDPWIAAVGLTLLALDPSFLMLSRVDVGPTVLSMVCKTLAAWQAAVWWDTGRRRSLVVAGLAMGVGLWDKANFSWLLAAYALGVLAVLGRRALRRMGTADVVAGMAGLLVGALPFIAYNTASSLASLRAVSTPYFQDGPEGGPLAQLHHRLGAFLQLLSGRGAASYLSVQRPQTFPLLAVLFMAAVVYLGTRLVRHRDRGV